MSSAAVVGVNERDFDRLHLPQQYGARPSRIEVAETNLRLLKVPLIFCCGSSSGLSV